MSPRPPPFKLSPVGHLERLLGLRELHHADHRAEDLLVADAHVERAASQECRRKEIRPQVMRELAPDHRLCALL